ncbi:hypothetical protein HYDPIDRAFT_26972 [Hydnomerulius pinastri MD-312]|nr:hypothetical protein HYDPIDRAFT_26972 [Hydnomerulius pinastri MD-312]
MSIVRSIQSQVDHWQRTIEWHQGSIEHCKGELRGLLTTLDLERERLIWRGYPGGRHVDRATSPVVLAEAEPRPKPR